MSDTWGAKEIIGHRRAPITGLYIPDVPDDADNLTAALDYAVAGCYVLPVKRGTEKPGSVVGNQWQHKSSRDPKVIAAWFAATDHDIALHCGRSGAVVFDVDDPDKLPDVLAAYLLGTPVPYQSTRPDQLYRGHYLFAMPADRTIGNSTGQLGSGWGEVRGLNGVIIVAPSSHKDGGRYPAMPPIKVHMAPSFVVPIEEGMTAGLRRGYAFGTRQPGA